MATAAAAAASSATTAKCHFLPGSINSECTRAVVISEQSRKSSGLNCLRMRESWPSHSKATFDFFFCFQLFENASAPTLKAFIWKKTHMILMRWQKSRPKKRKKYNSIAIELYCQLAVHWHLQNWIIQAIFNDKINSNNLITEGLDPIHGCNRQSKNKKQKMSY